MNVTQYLHNVIQLRFPALTHANFRKYWLGQCVSLIGTWMQSIGQTWLVFSLTGSPLLLGILGAAQFLPITFFSLFAGVVIDKYPKRNILLLTQFISMILAFTLSLLVFTHSVKYEYVLLLAFILGCCNSIDLPTRQAFTIEMAGKQDLMNAIALNSATFNLARIIGPAVGALVMASFGAGWCFFLNGFSYVAVLISLFKISVTPYVRKEVSKTVFKEIKDGLSYIAREPSLLQTILMVLIIGLFVYNFNILLPVFTQEVLHQREQVFGLLMSALGFGSFLGAIMVSITSQTGPHSRILVISTLTVSILFVLISFTHTFFLTALFLLLAGMATIWFSTNANSTLQITAKDEYRGRVMSVYSLVFAGSTPIGNMFAGFIAGKIGAGDAFLISGLVTLSSVGLLKLIFKNKKEKCLSRK